MWRSVATGVVLAGVPAVSFVWWTTRGPTHPQTFHVGYGTSVLASAAPGDKVLCPHNGGGVVPNNQYGVAGSGSYAQGFSGTVSFSISPRQAGGVVVRCRRAG
jgi:hypothetical protein